MEIHRADRALRVTTLAAIVALTAAGVFIVPYFQAWLADLSHLPTNIALTQIRTLLIWTAGIGGMSLLAMSFYLWHLGSRICAEKQFPLPGSRILRDTVILHEASAVRRGAITKALAVTLALCDVAILYFGWNVFLMLAPNP